MRVVMKFGGSTLSDNEAFDKISSIVKEYVERGDEVIMVVSAFPGVTDELIQMTEICLLDNSGDIAEELTSKLRKKHYSIVNMLLRDGNKEAILDRTLSCR